MRRLGCLTQALITPNMRPNRLGGGDRSRPSKPGDAVGREVWSVVDLPATARPNHRSVGVKKTLVVLCVVCLVGAVEAQSVKVSGYLGPNLRLIDKREGYSSNLGFGMAFNRFTLSGEAEAGSVVKKVGWNVEIDVSGSGGIALQNSYVQPSFNDALSFRIGHFKKAFGRELLHPTAKLLTVDRSPSSGKLRDRGYGDFNYGLELMLTQPRFKVTAGAYAGSPPLKGVDAQDPGVDFGARAIFKATPCLEVGANAMLISLFQDGNNCNEYPEDVGKNTGFAFGFDLGLNRDFGNMNLQALLEFGQGDNPDSVSNQADPFENWDYKTLRYYTAKALLKVTPSLGIHFGYAFWDPDTDTDDDGETVITPGLTYFWSKTLRTQLEAQLVSPQGKGDDLTHLVLQQVLVW